MAKLPSKNTFASETADSFGGINRTKAIGKLSEAYDIINMRIQPDGSLTRREGYRCFMDYSTTIRCAMTCPTDPSYVFVLADEILYSVNMAENTSIELSRGFNTYAPAFFFRIHDLAYLFCEGLYGIQPDGLVYKNGYVPLVGKNWGADGGEIYEQQNMLAFNIRIDYLLDRDTGTLFTGFDLGGIDAVYVNGQPVTGSYIERQNVCLPAVFPAGTRVLLCLSLALSQVYDILSLFSCTAGYSYGHGENSTAILYGGEEPSRLFYLSHIPQDKVAEAQVYYPDSLDIYCPATPTHVKNLNGGVRAICGESDCLIVAGQYEILRLTDNISTPIVGMEGCDSPASMTYFDGIAYIATAEGIWRLPLREGKGAIISTPLGDRMDSETSKSAMLYYNEYRDELLVRDTLTSSEWLYIYDPARKIWVCFSDIAAKGFFHVGPTRSVGFWTQMQLIKLLDSQDYDMPRPGKQQPIYSYYISQWTSLGKPDAPKRLRRARLTQSGYSQVTMLIQDNTGYLCQHVFPTDTKTEPDFCDVSIHSGRTNQFRVMLFSSNVAPMRIHNLTLSAIK